MNNVITPFNVALLGFDERSRDTMELIFHGPGKRCCVITDEPQAEAVIVNLDNVDGQSLWQAFRRRYPDHPAIIMAVKDPGVGDAAFLGKPVRQDDLLAAVKSLAQRHPRGGAAASSPKPEQPVLQPVRESMVLPTTLSEDFFYDPKMFLQGELTDALAFAQRKEVSITLQVRYGGITRDIVLLPSLKRAIHDINSAQLTQLCSTPACLLDVSVRRLGDNEALALERDVNERGVGEALDAFLWRVARRTSGGRLPVGTDSAVAVYISRWPNFTRLEPINHAMRITALLIEQSRPLPLVAKVLGLRLQEVFTFYAAAHAIGLVGASQRGVDQLLHAQVPAPPRQHGLFGRLLKRLKDIGKAPA